MGGIKEIIKKGIKGPVMLVNRLVLQSYMGFAKSKVGDVKKLSITDSRVMILAPHQDDEVLGCGFLIQQLTKNNCRIKTVFSTDGSGSDGEQGDKIKLAQSRKNEARAVAKYLKAEGPAFLEMPDGEGKIDEGAARELAEIINVFEPQYLFIPYFLDGHRDHTALSGIYLNSLKYVNKVDNINTFAYEINSPISVYGITHYIEGQGMMDKKVKALQMYESQTMTFDPILLVNRLNNILLGLRGDGAELFKELSLESYKRAYEAFNPDNQIWARFRPLYSIYYVIPAYFKGMKLKKDIARYMEKQKSAYLKGDRK